MKGSSLTRYLNGDIQVHLKKIEYGEQVHFIFRNLFKNVKFPYILDALHVK